jgi:hypothetical protein
MSIDTRYYTLNAPLDKYLFCYKDSGFNYVVNMKSGRVIKPHFHTTGYMRYMFWVDGKSYRFKVHQLVGEAFKVKPADAAEIDHIDRNPMNNSYCNLMWRTKSENCKNIRSRGKGYYERKHKNKTNYEICLRGKYISVADTEEEAFEIVQELRRQHQLELKYSLMWMNKTFQSVPICA